MAKEKIYPKGFVCFAKNEKAPDFVKGTIIITLEDFKEWVNGDGKQYLTDYKGKKQLKLQLTEWEGRPSLSVDTFKPEKNEGDF